MVSHAFPSKQKANFTTHIINNYFIFYFSLCCVFCVHFLYNLFSIFIGLIPSVGPRTYKNKS